MTSSDTRLLFDTIPVVKQVIPIIKETSGIADSKANPGYLWAQEDGNNPPQLYLLKHDGKVFKKIYLKGAKNRDWEDMVLAGNTIYIGDIGDNAHVYPDYTIYKFKEPRSSVDTISAFEQIRFKYPDGSHDAEAFLVDAVTKNIYILTKAENPSKIYKLQYPYTTTGLNIASLVDSVRFTGVVSAAASADGQRLIVKTYTHLYHYIRKKGESIEQTLHKEGTKLHYQVEPQGEAVTFAADNASFFTLSEKGFGFTVNLFFYKKK